MNVKLRRRHPNVDTLNSRIAASRAYSEACMSVLARALSRRGFVLSIQSVDSSRKSPDFHFVEASVFMGGMKVGLVTGSFGNKACNLPGRGFNLCLQAAPGYDDSVIPGTDREGFRTCKRSRCVRGRPKVRKWAAWCAKHFYEYMTLAAIPDVALVTES